MKYIFLLFCAVGWQLFAKSEVYAQIDSVMIEIKSIPTRHSWDYTNYNNINGSEHSTGSDTTRYGITQRAFLFDSLSRSADTIFYYQRNRGGASLTIVYDNIQSQFRYLRFNYSNIGYLGLGDGFGISLSNVSVIETASAFELALFGSELSSHNFSFGAHHGDMAAPMSPHIDSWNSLGYTDSLSSISILMTKTTILAVHPSPQAKGLVTLTPQPASRFINVDFPLTYSIAAITIFDLLGRIVMSDPISPGTQHMRLDASSLPPGIYYLRAGNQMQKFVIQR